MKGYERVEDKPEEPKPPAEVEIIPSQRRSRPAAVERMMRETFEPEIVEPQPELCRHGSRDGECRVIELGHDCPHYYNRDESKYRYA